jgi:hypothetical protein
MLGVDRLQHGFECVEVRVDVGDDGDLHERTEAQRR